MTYGGCTVNVRDMVEMESQGHIILIMNGKVEKGKVEMARWRLARLMSSSSSPHSQSDERDENHGQGGWNPKKIQALIS
ncbi:hypothetical protein Acr_17g0007420 [Actinidia rufa]|uniref:Uncharacterized protein n=1 Tax=Actinidia rufa TaxID=165716 RepID=A0A7J0G310_9ERIC|nr:hypothetical protein Acr_17g0007420 [Actinidia rufa]